LSQWTDQIDGKAPENVGNGDVATDGKAEETADTEDKKTEDAAPADEAPAEENMDVDEKEQNLDETAEKQEEAPVDA
jgi:hypothetical protein